MRRAKSSCVFSPTTFRNRSSISTAIAATRSSTKRSCAWSASNANRSSASNRKTFPGSTSPSSLAPNREQVETGEAINFEREVVDASGRNRWIRARAVPDLRFDGTLKGAYVVGHDITDLKQTQDALAAREGQLRAIMDGVPAPVAYIDRDERCHYVNRSFLQYFGLSPEQVAANAPARYRRAGDLPERAGHADARDGRRIDGLRSAGARRQWRAALDDDSRRARRQCVRRSARRVRADERYPWT